MRRAAKTDANQKRIVDAFRQMGFSVLLLHQVGHGCPDILISKHKRNVLVEIKDGDQVPSKRKLTEDQVHFHDVWQGEIFIVVNVADAIALALKIEQEAL